MKQCPACKRQMKEHLRFCPFDGELLVNEAEQDKFIGTLIDQKYRLEEKIGEGGMGIVYKATHVLMDNPVAVKIINPQLASDRVALERFHREARAAARIRHPNAIAVTDFGVAREIGLAYLVMEFLEGLELRERIKEKKQLDYEEAQLILHQTCAALQVAHSKDIIHRDLKPENIWILKTEDGSEQIKVLDFGIAKLKEQASTGPLTQQGMIMGTPFYMSPEQCRGEELDVRADVYSLGIILYEMLTGEVPFKGPTPMGIALQHSTEMPRPPQELRADLPIQVQDVILRALEKGKEGRQESAIKLSQEFEAALHEAGIEFKQLGADTPKAGMALTSKLDATPAATTNLITAEEGGAGQDSSARPAVAMASSREQTRLQLPSESSPSVERAEGLPYRAKAARVSRKLLLISAAAVVALGLTVGIYWWKQQKAALTEVPNPGATEPHPTGALHGMIQIQAGEFTMGYNGSKDIEAEKPEHLVTVKSFYIDQHEVTNEQYNECVKAGGCSAPPHWIGGEFKEGEERFPVVLVRYTDAEAYARWAGKRLPTEEEWEYAARGPDKLLYPWGNRFDPNKANTKESGKNYLLPVGSYPGAASPFNVMDMAGNVAEWTASDFAPYPGSNIGPVPNVKVVRGGSFSQTSPAARTTARRYFPPGERRNYLGFRCVRDVP